MGNRKFEIEYLSLEALTKPKPPRAALAPLTPVNFLTSERDKPPRVSPIVTQEDN